MLLHLPLRSQNSTKRTEKNAAKLRDIGGALLVVTTIDYMPTNGSHYRSNRPQMRVLPVCHMQHAAICMLLLPLLGYIAAATSNRVCN